MARKRTSSRAPRSTSRIVPRSVVSPIPSFRLGPVDPLGVHVLRHSQDLRTWHPERRLRPISALPRSAARLVVKSRPNALRNDISNRIGFAIPKRVAVCVRRKQRKEVLHALGKAGGGVSRRRRRNEYSNLDC